MGDPKKPKKKYKTPTHPWQKERIEEEKVLVREYGIKNKKEIWKAQSLLSNFKSQAKKYASVSGVEKNKDLLLDKLIRLGILKDGKGLDDVLGLDVKDILERRLQTVVVRRRLASTMTQARQFIVHNHIAIGNKKLSVPSYLVKVAEENDLQFAETSSMKNEDHPEIVNIQNKKRKEE